MLGLRKSVLAGVGFAGSVLTVIYFFRNKTAIEVAARSLALVAVFALGVATSIMVGIFLGFQGQLSPLVDRLSVLSELLFLTVVLAVCCAPAALYVTQAHLAAEEAEALRKAEEQKGQDGDEQAKGAVAKMKSEVTLLVTRVTNMAGVSAPTAPTPKYEMPGDELRNLAIVPVAMLLLIGVPTFLGVRLSSIFILAAVVGGYLMRRKSLQQQLSFAVVGAIAFGAMHAFHLGELRSTTRVNIAGAAEPQRGTVLMNTSNGVILVKAGGSLTVVPWGEVRSLEVLPQEPLVTRAQRSFATLAANLEYLRAAVSSFNLPQRR